MALQGLADNLKINPSQILVLVPYNSFLSCVFWLRKRPQLLKVHIIQEHVYSQPDNLNLLRLISNHR